MYYDTRFRESKVKQFKLCMVLVIRFQQLAVVRHCCVHYYNTALGNCAEINFATKFTDLLCCLNYYQNDAVLNLFVKKVFQSNY
jgi:hypothetical protein